MRIVFTGMPLWAALVPLAAYLMAIGAVHLRRKPVALSGQVDALLLATAVSGFVMVGPLALLQPATGTSAWTAVALLLGFALLVGCALLAARPRLIVYNVGIDQLRPVVAEVVAGLDAAARWAGETAALPTRGLQIHLDDRGPARSVSIIAAGGRPSAESWSEFSRRLRRATAGLRVRSSPWGGGFAALGAALAGTAVWLAIRG
jgi:hypothetical protein